ncbi:hypothetical protein TAMYLO_330082 [Tenacibaculum amylolyticum]
MIYPSNMEQKDELKELLKTIDTVHENVNLEIDIIQQLEKQEKIQAEIIQNRRYGFMGMMITLVLTVLIIFNTPNLDEILRKPIFQLGICGFILILFFIQLETASKNSKKVYKS